MATNNGWAAAGESLGNLLTGAGREEAFQAGRYRSAQTEQALSAARKSQEDALKAATQRGLVDRVAASDTASLLGDELMGAIIAGGMGGDFSSYGEGRLRNQEYDFRAQAADPTASALERTRVLGAISGKPYSDLQATGSHGVVDLTSDTPAVQGTALSDSLIDRNRAQAAASNELAALRERTPAQGGAAGTGGTVLNPELMTETQGVPTHPITGVRAPVGRWWVRGENGEPTLSFIPGSSADPNAPQAGGAREAAFRGRVLNAASQANATARNIMALRSGASSGVLGVGASPGRSILGSAKGALTNRVASQDAQSYNALLAGLTRNLATIESAGVVPSDTFTGSFNALELREGDTELTKLQKIAEIRQTIEAGLEPELNNPRVPPVQKEYMQKLVDNIVEAIPFTVEDVIALYASPDRGETIGDVVKRRGFSNRATPSSQQPTPPAASQGGWTIEEVQ